MSGGVNGSQERPRVEHLQLPSISSGALNSLSSPHGSRTILATLMEVEEEEEGWEERKEANRQPIEPASSHKSVDTMLSSGNSTRTNSIDSTHEDGTMESLLESVGLDRQGKPQHCSARDPRGTLLLPDPLENFWGGEGEGQMDCPEDSDDFFAGEGDVPNPVPEPPGPFFHPQLKFALRPSGGGPRVKSEGNSKQGSQVGLGGELLSGTNPAALSLETAALLSSTLRRLLEKESAAATGGAISS